MAHWKYYRFCQLHWQHCKVGTRKGWVIYGKHVVWCVAYLSPIVGIVLLPSSPRPQTPHLCHWSQMIRLCSLMLCGVMVAPTVSVTVVQSKSKPWGSSLEHLPLIEAVKHLPVKDELPLENKLISLLCSGCTEAAAPLFANVGICFQITGILLT